MTDQPEDTFEISLRILGNEIVGLRLNSQSRARNWVVIAMICFVIVATVAADAIPALIDVIGAV